jgi:hypothetical protein
MNILIYASDKSNVWERLQESIEPWDLKIDLEVCRTIKHLLWNLRRSLTDFAAVVLVASNTRELSRLISISDLLDDRRTVVIVPNWDRHITSMAHMLRPRFLTSIDGNFSEVAAVVKKIIRNSDSTNFEERGKKNDKTG